jgi:hypothetical protein
MHRVKRLAWPLITLVALLVASAPVRAATFYNAAIQAQWQQGEAIAPNFWGPVESSRIEEEDYVESKNGQRFVQYFDKGRMEITNTTTGQVTNGLLAWELIMGFQQIGDAKSRPMPPPALPIAGDSDNPGPTYAQLGLTGLLKEKPRYDVAVQGPKIPYALTATGNVETPGPGSTQYPNGAPFHPALGLDTYDATTKHNIPFAFAQYRNRAGLATIGLAISEPFWTRVKVGGVQRDVLVQAFERRILTFTPTNPQEFQVEMGNIGQHYHRWRYGN